MVQLMIYEQGLKVHLASTHFWDLKFGSTNSERTLFPHQEYTIKPENPGRHTEKKQSEIKPEIMQCLLQCNRQIFMKSAVFIIV